RGRPARSSSTWYSRNGTAGTSPHCRTLVNPPTDLLPYLVREADRLGQLAAEGHLSIFVGAGVSVPLGLPAWAEFVNALLSEAGWGQIPADADEPTLLEGA